MLSSSKVATLAGTTVRALRHYHQLGLLPEPERSRNGYRDYAVTDLVRVLRIRTLAELGIPLNQMPPLLHDRSDAASAVLDDLDAELVATIERLTRQRAALSVLRERDLAPDIPPEFGRVMALLSAVSTPMMRAADEDLAVLVLHLTGDAYVPLMEQLYTLLGSGELAGPVSEVSQRFDGLATVAVDDEAVLTLAADYVRLIQPMLVMLRDQVAALGELSPEAQGLLAAFSSEQLSPAQLEVMRLVEGALSPAGNEHETVR